jgi:hypothetical protein
MRYRRPRQVTRVPHAAATIANQFTMIDDPAPALSASARAAFYGELRYAGNRGQGLAAKTQSGDPFNRLIGQFGSGMTFQRQGNFCRAHPAAIVGHVDQIEPAADKLYRNCTCTGVDRIFGQFLERRGRTFNHFTRCDPVDEGFGKAANNRHGPILAMKCLEFETGRTTYPVIRHKFLAFAQGLG